MRHRGSYRPLHRVIDLDVAVDRGLEQPAQRQHAGVLAGAVVVYRRVDILGAGPDVHGLEIQGRMRAAHQVLLSASYLVQHLRHGLRVPRLAGMTGAAERDLAAVEIQPCELRMRDERHGLEGLEAGAREDDGPAVAAGVQGAAAGIHHRDRAVMHRLDDAAARGHRERDMPRHPQRGIRHGSRTSTSSTGLRVVAGTSAA